VVISTRNLKPVYDVETLIRAIPLVLQQIPEARFIVAGEGEQRAYLENLARGLGVLESVRFVGWIAHHELTKYLASADVYVSTSLSDGTSVSLLEALACELAPVVTDIPANRPWVHDGENGFLIPVREYEMLADGIIRLLEDEGLRAANRGMLRIIFLPAWHASEGYLCGLSVPLAKLSGGHFQVA
ncbi:unnamed protein product, partial [marine sediment metagenome]